MGYKFNPFTGKFDDAGSTPSGTANTLAYFNSTGDLDDLINFDVNAFAGLDIVQAVGLTDGGLAVARILNSKTYQISATNNQTTDFLYGLLEQVDLAGTFDYNGYTHEETLIQQSGQHDINADVILNFKRLHLGVGGVSSSTNSRAIKGQIRISSAHTATSLIGVDGEILMDGGSIAADATGLKSTVYTGGTASNSYGLNTYVQNAGTVLQNIYGINQGLATDVGATTENVIAINSNYTGDIVNNYQGLLLTTNGDFGAATHVNINSTGDVTNTEYGFNYSKNGDCGNGIIIINTNVNSSSVINGDLRHINLYAESTVSNNGGFLGGIQNGNVAGNWTGIGQTFGADAGSGLNFHNDVVNNGAAITGSVFGHSVSLGNDVTVSNLIYGFSLNNQAPADGVEGFLVSNSANLVNGFRGAFIQDTGNSRTKTGIDMSLSGAVADDAQGIRINVTGLTMATQRAFSGTFEGGAFGVQSQMVPFGSLGVDVGNNITMTSTVANGSPLTGTDQIIQLIQSNLIANDDIATGPFGLNTTMLGGISQVQVTSGKTIPLLRSMLLGTSVPGGSGGTITEHVTLEIIGLPSFGGSVTCPTKIAVQDAVLLGQNFSDGTTEAWFIRNQDPNTENHLSMLAIGTANKKVTNASVGLEMGSVTRVFRQANLTTAQRNALIPLAGMQIFNTDTGVIETYDGVNWI